MFAAPKPGVDLAALAQAGSGDSSGASAIEFVDMLGGVSYIGGGHEATAMVDLPEGIVLAMCFVPDPNGDRARAPRHVGRPDGLRADADCRRPRRPRG